MVLVEWDGAVQVGYNPKKERLMATITTRDGTEIYYNDWGSDRPICSAGG